MPRIDILLIISICIVFSIFLSNVIDPVYATSTSLESNKNGYNFFDIYYLDGEHGVSNYYLNSGPIKDSSYNKNDNYIQEYNIFKVSNLPNEHFSGKAVAIYICKYYHS